MEGFDRLIRDIFRYQTVEFIRHNPYFFIPISIGLVNAVDCLIVKKEHRFEKDENKRAKLSKEVDYRLMMMSVIDVPTIFLGTVVTYFMKESTLFINTMLNSSEKALMESASKELTKVNEKLIICRGAMKFMVFGGFLASSWFVISNWYKGRDGWFRSNLRKAALIGNIGLLYLLSKPLKVEFR